MFIGRVWGVLARIKRPIAAHKTTDSRMYLQKKQRGLPWGSLFFCLSTFIFPSSVYGPFTVRLRFIYGPFTVHLRYMGLVLAIFLHFERKIQIYLHMCNFCSNFVPAINFNTESEKYRCSFLWGLGRRHAVNGEYVCPVRCRVRSRDIHTAGFPG